MELIEYNIGFERPSQAKPILYSISDNGCWEIQSHKRNANGYGVIWFKQKPYLLHRVSYCLANNLDFTNFSSELIVRHKCDNPCCFNPKHLEIGTMKDNTKDMYDRNRATDNSGVANGRTSLTEEEVIEIYHSEGLGKDIAEKFGVSIHTVSRIKNKKTFKKILENL